MTDRVLSITIWPAWCAHAALCGIAVTTARLIDAFRSTP